MRAFGMVFGAITIPAAYAALNYYIGKRLFQWLRLLLPSVSGILFTCIYVFLAISLFLSFIPLPFILRSILRFISAYWTGVFLYFLLLFAVTDLVLLIGVLIKMIPRPIPQIVGLYRGSAVLIITAGLICYGVINAGHLKNVTYDVKMEKALQSEMRIVLISDLHLGEIGTEKRLESLVKGVNELNPDIVCIAGDIFGDDYTRISDPNRAIALLKSIEAEYGVYACFGNHDGGRTLDRMLVFLEDCNIRLLKDEYVIIDERLALLGRLDSSPIGGSGDLRRSDAAKIIASIDKNQPVVVIDHNPAHINEYGKDVDLILAGHTHKGQLFPINLLISAMYDADYGYYQKETGSPRVVVTQGAGTWLMPFRIGSNNEIALITLR